MEPGERSDPGRGEMKAFFKRIRLAEAQDVLVLDRFRPKVDKKFQRNCHVLSFGPALVPSCREGSLFRKAGIT